MRLDAVCPISADDDGMGMKEVMRLYELSCPRRFIPFHSQAA